MLLASSPTTDTIAFWGGRFPQVRRRKRVSMTTTSAPNATPTTQATAGTKRSDPLPSVLTSELDTVWFMTALGTVTARPGTGIVVELDPVGLTVGTQVGSDAVGAAIGSVVVGWKVGLLLVGSLVGAKLGSGRQTTDSS